MKILAPIAIGLTAILAAAIVTLRQEQPGSSDTAGASGRRPGSEQRTPSNEIPAEQQRSSHGIRNPSPGPAKSAAISLTRPSPPFASESSLSSPAGNFIRPPHSTDHSGPAAAPPGFQAEEDIPSVGHAPQPARRPAFSAEIPDTPQLSPENREKLQALAEDWYEEAASIPTMDPESPIFGQAWDDAVNQADFLFRQRFGQHAWLQHHIQSHHLSSGTSR